MRCLRGAQVKGSAAARSQAVCAVPAYKEGQCPRPFCEAQGHRIARSACARAGWRSSCKAGGKFPRFGSAPRILAAGKTRRPAIRRAANACKSGCFLGKELVPPSAFDCGWPFSAALRIRGLCRHLPVASTPCARHKCSGGMPCALMNVAWRKRFGAPRASEPGPGHSTARGVPNLPSADGGSPLSARR